MVHFVKKYSALLSVSAIALLVVSCANMASPSGGDYDLDPPKVVKTTPGFNAVNVKGNKVEIVFDENVVLEKQSEKIIVTPPQRLSPVIRSVNKKVTVELRDTLLANTTYTIDFTDAVVDNNEKNVLENFTYSFSTGSYIDTLAVSGKVLSANNLEPIKGIFVGMHSNLSDTMFTTTKFERISRTNDRGEFTIRGIAPGRYRLYALDDINRDYYYKNRATAIAFLDTIIEPSSKPDMHQDTTFVVKDGQKIVESVADVHFTRFMPDNIVMRSFQSDFKRRYLQKSERSPQKITFYFGAESELPELTPLAFDPNSDWSVLERSAKNDTLTYWIKDKSISTMDTIPMAIKYLKTDSLDQHQSVTDTLYLVDRTFKKKEKKKDPKKKEEITFLQVAHNIEASMNIYSDISLEFNEPIDGNLDGKVKLQIKVDSLYNDIENVNLVKDSLNPRKFLIKHKWEYGESFRVVVDSASVHGMYGLWNNKLEQLFTIRKQDQYGNILLTVLGIDADMPAFVELLDKQDNAIRSVRLRKGQALFRNILPGEYYTRITLDENNNGRWDTGDYYQNKQPEMVCYNNKMFTVRANWDIEEDWTVDVTKIGEQKPLEITKNKPEAKESRREQLEKEEQKKDKKAKRQREQQNSTGRGTGGSTSLERM